MRKKDFWRPRKYIETPNGLRASRDSLEVGLGSRFVAYLQAAAYEKAIRLHAKGLLLDLGCRKVPLFGIYRNYVTDNICVDWSNTYHRTPNLDCELNLGMSMPFPSGCFDTILVTDVMEHISDPFLVWQEISRLLRPSGKLIIGVPFLHPVHEEPFDYFKYTEFSLRMLSERNDLCVTSLISYGGSIEVISDILAKHLAFSRFLSALHLLMAKTFSSLILGHKMRHMTSAKFPLGYCLVAQKTT